MGLVDDILKGLPENSVLREKVGRLSEENESLKMEVASLKDDLREARAKHAKLEKRVAELTHIDLNETDVKLLRLIAEAKHSEPWAEILAEMLGLHLARVEFHLERLVESEYIHRNFAYDGMPDTYALLQKGRNYLIEHNLI